MKRCRSGAPARQAGWCGEPKGGFDPEAVTAIIEAEQVAIWSAVPRIVHSVANAYGRDAWGADCG